MSFVDNEIFDNVIVGEYRDDKGLGAFSFVLL